MNSLQALQYLQGTSMVASVMQIWYRFSPKLKILRDFAIAQALVQTITMACGFLLVRLLPVSSYAKYSVFNGVSSSALLLTDVGLSGTLIALVGSRCSDLQLVADYVRTLRGFRRRLFYVMAPLALIVFPLLTARQRWPGLTVSALAVALVLNMWASGVASSYSAVLIIRGDRRVYYSIQASITALRLMLIFASWALHNLTLLTSIAIALVCTSVTAASYFLRSNALLKTEGRSVPSLQRQVLHLGLPNIPNVVFYAFQGQITIFLITFFGQSRQIASVGALSRIAQVFLMLSQMNPVLVEPYFAKLAAHRLLRTYLLCLCFAATCITFAILFAAVYPTFFLAFLGPNYRSLDKQVALIVASSGLGYLAGLAWTMQFARKFIFWWATWVNMGVICVIELIFVLKFDLSTIEGVVLLGLATSAGSLAVTLSIGVMGFLKGPRTLASELLHA